ncbi:TrbI/VirB10 family protein [Herbaspirillum sp. ST 5-3]|uniref:TrbI/VirB10 family protein n=1 Tax=Oxalobacteraceae TaxID=75682 RepID=UPI0010A41852|nr:TrbI/VirB10 family protein [Herbaspirillum sp. ST 5-3]
MMAIPSSLKSALDKLSPKQRQFAMLGSIMTVGISALWAVFALTDHRSKTTAIASSSVLPATVTNIGVMAGGQQVNPVDQWVGTAGKKLAQYDADKQEQTKINADRKAFEDNILRRFAEFEQKQTAASQATNSSSSLGTPSGTPAGGMRSAPVAPPANYPPAAALSGQGLPPQPPTPRGATTAGMPAGVPGNAASAFDVPVLVRVAVGTAAKPAPAPGASTGATNKDGDTKSGTVDTYLPVSFTRGILLGGLDAPTGGQSQSNPHPVLIRLADNAVLPNRFRSDVKECFVIAAGYGDISSERAYLRTENLSCVRNDGSTLEVKIQGSVYGEDGKVGMRGRLVTKQGQMLANALTAGIVSGIGQGFYQAGTTVSTSTFGTVATTEGGTREQIERGIGAGVGRAMDRLAQYYIRLAEQSFPVIEIDAGRQVDVVITKGVRIDSGESNRNRPTSLAQRDAQHEDSYGRNGNDDDY